MKRFTFVSSSALIAYLFVSGNAFAQENPGLVYVNFLSASSGGGPLSEGTSLRLRGYEIYSQANGHFNVGDNVPGVTNNIDLENTLGMDLDKLTGGGLIGFDSGRLHFDVSYNGYYDYTGKKNVGSIAINGNVYTAEVDSTARVQEGDMHFGYDIWKPQNLGLTLSSTLDLHVYYIDAKVREVTSALHDSEQLWAPVPSPGMSLRWDITPNIYVKGTAAGFYAGNLANYLDLSAELGIDLTRNLGLFIGYRYWLLNLDYDNNSFEFKNGSIYAGVELRI